MRPSAILPQCLPSVFSTLHAATATVLLKALDALASGSWLTMTEIARHWPGAMRVAAPLKAIDRLLRSAPLERQRAAIYQAMLRWLIREPHPLIVVDWSDLKPDGSFKLLRAGLAVRGRTLTLWEEVHPEKSAGSAVVERAFLRTLASLLPQGCRPVILSDAGFRRPWFTAVTALGWDYVGRVRGTVHAQPVRKAAINAADWLPCSALHELALPERSRELGAFHLGRTKTVTTRIVVHQSRPKGRRALTRRGARRRDSTSQSAARSAREPWVLATSLPPERGTPVQLACLYQRRMTIEQGFRDLKSGTFGAGFEHSLTRKDSRLSNLLLLFALVQLATWLVGLHEEHQGRGGRLEGKNTCVRSHHSTMRLGVEVLRRPAWWPSPHQLLRFLSHLAHGAPPPLQTCPLS